MQIRKGLKITGVGLCLVLAAFHTASAQIDLRIETPKTAYLQFSPIPFTVRIKNLGAGELKLTSDNGKPWLEMIVQSRDGLLIAPEKMLTPPDKTLRSGESVAIPVDLAPQYLIRDTGGYRARASVRLPSGEALMTDSLDFLIGRGEVIWSVPRGDGNERRIYSLLKFYEDPNMGLYLRVEVPEKNLVYPSRRLGAYLPLGKPAAEFDPQNNLHLLYAISAGNYRLSVVNPDGQILREETRQQGPDKPVLQRKPDGEVSVEGGIVQLPSSLRERLSTLQARIGTQVPPKDPMQP
jgi:hypothetical protein